MKNYISLDALYDYIYTREKELTEEYLKIIDRKEISIPDFNLNMGQYKTFIELERWLEDMNEY